MAWSSVEPEAWGRLSVARHPWETVGDRGRPWETVGDLRERGERGQSLLPRHLPHLHGLEDGPCAKSRPRTGSSPLGSRWGARLPESPALLAGLRSCSPLGSSPKPRETAEGRGNQGWQRSANPWDEGQPARPHSPLADGELQGTTRPRWHPVPPCFLLDTSWQPQWRTLGPADRYPG